LIADPDQEAVRKFARAYGADKTVLVRPEEDRYTVLYRPRHIVASPVVSG
jgi:hypothetical protein